MTERQSARMSKIKNDGLGQYGAEPFKQQQFGTAGTEGVKMRCAECSSAGDEVRAISDDTGSQVERPSRLSHYVNSTSVGRTHHLGRATASSTHRTARLAARC